MLSSSKIFPTTKVLNIDNYSDGRERHFGKSEPLAAIARNRGCDPDYESGLGSQALAGLRILVVDDEPDCATLTGYLLSQWGADVKVVSSATEALEVFERYQIWPPDILVSDIQMPAIDGYELMRRVRNMEFGSRREYTGHSPHRLYSRRRPRPRPGRRVPDSRR